MYPEDERLRYLTDIWRVRALEAQELYLATRTPEHLKAFRETLAEFAALVKCGVIPRE